MTPESVARLLELAEGNIATIREALRHPTRDYRPSDRAIDVLADVVPLVRDWERLRTALVEAEYGLREARDYGNEWPIGLDTDPQEQRGMDRDTFINNMEHFIAIARAALDLKEEPAC